MPIKSAKTIAEPQRNFCAVPGCPVGTRLSAPNSALYLLMPIESAKTIAARKEILLGKVSGDTSVSIRRWCVATESGASMSWVAGRGRQVGVVVRGAGWQAAHCYGKPLEQPFSQRPHLRVQREPVESPFRHGFNRLHGLPTSSPLGMRDHPG